MFITYYKIYKYLIKNKEKNKINYPVFSSDLLKYQIKLHLMSSRCVALS
jgi:hypothetical protein